MKKGTKVVFTVDNLGTTENPGGTRFAAPVAMSGQEGSYYGPHPELNDWHIISTFADERFVYCPVHKSQFVQRDLARP